MKAKDLMDAIGGISDRHIEKYAEVKPVVVKRAEKEQAGDNKRRRLIAFAAAAAAVIVAALVMIPMISKLRGNDDPSDIVADNSPAVVNTPAPTKEPSVTPDATQIPEPTATAEATSPAPTEPSYDITDYKSEHAQYVFVSNAVLAGEDISSDEAFSLDGGGVFFGVEDGKLTAYAEAIIHDEPGSLHYELLEPIAYYPYELGALAAKSVSDYIRRNIDPDFAGDDELQLFGYIGENYIIFTDEPFHGRQAYALFYSEDGENWTELSAIPQRVMQLTGGCVLSASEAYLCFFDRSQMMFDDYTPRRLTVYRTADGGKTWKDIELWIPEEYEGIVAPPAAALSPVFKGERGVIIVTYTTYNSETEGFDSHTSWFETEDGGESWEFHLE